ncbi:Virginiamycin B lyase [Aquimixticola soesokkakensis]|uniref:Virginiamycin B lyase n=1 Tax=Aquimixticola soesokkakensis TaxID=1519096 RepID=A0A1Y5T8Z9_9RHOB|nr:hypothetical protein [Aquimixticola soesokkakensis]SLN56712.1 Virginiamycin B lyase [Aquimixticola soesokkakensis]
MTHSLRISQAVARPLCVVATLLASTQLAFAQTPFDTAAPFEGRVSISGPDGAPLYPGTQATVTGSGFVAGQTIEVERGDTLLVEGVTADAEGAFSATFDLDAEAVLGLHPVIVKTANPDSAQVMDVKVSPQIDYFGADQFDITKVQLDGGLYQVAVSEANGTLFVASAVGRPPVEESKLFKLDAATLEVLAEVTPAAAPAQGDRPGGVYAVYGVAADDAHGTVWVTNTRQNTVAVYSQDDLSLVKQFEDGTTNHPRDAVVDATRGRVYVSAGTDGIKVFDTQTLELVETIDVPSALRRETFNTMSLALDEADGLLYTVSLTTPEAARIDLASGEVTNIAVPGGTGAIGVDISEDGALMFVTTPNGDDLKIFDAEGSELVDVPVGVQPLNVVYVDGAKLAFVANRGSDSLAVVTPEGELVANLPGGPNPNFVEESKDGVVYLVNKARDEAEDANTLWRIAPK